MATTTLLHHLSPNPHLPISSCSSSKLFAPFTNSRIHLLHYHHRYHHRYHHHFVRKTTISRKPLPSSYRNGGNGSDTPPLPETECPVPFEQQPINEYQTLSTSFPFAWASGDFVEYCSRLFVTGASFALFIGLPVAWFGSVGPESEPLKRILAAGSSGVIVVTLAVVRMYLGWAYVGNRLLSATVEYEETGWYDGQIWVKTAEVLARDRLLGSFSVKPVLSRLKYTLVSLAASLFLCILLLINIEENQKVLYAQAEEARIRAIPGVYNDDSARLFEPDAFCGEPALH